VQVPVLDEAFSLEEVRAALKHKKNHKAPGPDKLRIDLLRILRYDDTVCLALANLFTIIMKTCETPDEWRRAYLFLLYKGKGDKTLADSFRGITLKSHMLKLFESLLERRLYRWMEARRLLPREQLAYRRGRSGVDHIFVLNVTWKYTFHANISSLHSYERRKSFEEKHLFFYILIKLCKSSWSFLSLCPKLPFSKS
jgi:hypothetical protein